MRETSLDDFIGGGDEDEVEEPESDAPEAAESAVDEPEAAAVDDADLDSEPGPDSDQVEPAVSTYDWTPTGADCEACGTAVERRWRDDGRLVCADCKAW